MDEAEYILRGITADELDLITDALSNESASLLRLAASHNWAGASFSGNRKEFRARAQALKAVAAKIVGQQSVTR